MRYNMAEIKIIIPKKVEYTKALTCIFHPPTDKAQMSFTLDGEDKPFRTGKISGRCKEISVFMFRPESLDVEKEEYTKPLKAGDIVNIDVTVNGTKKSGKVEIA